MTIQNIKPEKQNTGTRALASRKGIVLVFTLITMVTLVAITGAFLYMTAIQNKNSGYNVVSAKAFWLAEAGIHDALFQLKNDSNYRDNPVTINNSLGGGNYSVSVSKNGTTYSLTSTGTVSVINRQIIQSVLIEDGIPQAFSYVIHSGNRIRLNNSEGIVNGDISVATTVTGEGDMTINGTIAEGSTVPTPSVDFSSYASIANNVVSGNKTFQQNQTYSGIWYVDGKVTIQKNVTINGTIISTGDIILKKIKGLTITPSDPYPALVSGKDIKGNELEDSTINGLIYAVKKVKFNRTEDSTFNGSIIAGDSIDIKNGEDFTINYNSDIVNNPPPYFSGGGVGAVTVTPQNDWDEVVPSI